VCDSFEVQPLVQPSNLTKDDYEKDMGKKMMWETSMKSFMKRTDLQESNARAIYAIVWGQCSPMMKSKIESLDDFSDKSATRDCAWLLEEIQGITHRLKARETSSYLWTMHGADTKVTAKATNRHYMNI
jgi:hypothetical protein